VGGVWRYGEGVGCTVTTYPSAAAVPPGHTAAALAPLSAAAAAADASVGKVYVDVF